MSARIALLLLLALAASSASAGTFNDVVRRTRAVASTDANWVGPYAIVHPPGYLGLGGALVVRICALPAAEALIGPLQEALATWNELVPQSPNCENCYVAGEAATDPPVPYSARGVLLHELGHCALGLDHINLVETDATPHYYRSGTCDVNNDGICGATTNFTVSANASDVFLDLEDTAGDSQNEHGNACPFIPARADGSDSDLAVGVLSNLNLCESDVCPPGALMREDLRRKAQSERTCVEARGSTCSGVFLCPDPPICCPPCPGPECPITPMDVLDVAWYRTADNDPFVLVSTVIDKDSYSRSILNLPVGDLYAASANRLVGEALGYVDTQSVMYSLRDSDTVELGLAADDANMIRMGMSGADRDAGNSDDYFLTLAFTRDCGSAAVEIDLQDTGGSELGVCLAEIGLSYSQVGPVKLHYSLIPPGGSSRTSLTINSAATFNLGDWLFASTFESGDLTEWNSAEP